MDNETAWIHGIYVYDALAVCLSNAFSKKGAKKQNYTDKPFDLFPLTDKEKERREKEEYEKMNAILQRMQQQQRDKKKGD